ncbi:MAG: ribosome biogenesis GTPase Der [Coxiella sp. RIFCSPHIGHO2_12_FULL_42_15]|nr:MAG: ribosome biogenesis GTPase Der [Coxiella sp. RIFCSPHIGHO2_12_FULL_42_15]
MLPIITIIGRPNVGKSTLFNWLTRTRDALVADMPGVTRDRQYGRGVVGDRPYIVVDTGGIEESDDPVMAEMTEQQVQQAIQEAHVILFMVDGPVGRTPADEAIAKRLRPVADKVVVLVNKTDHHDSDVMCSEFFVLGFGGAFAIAAKRGQGVKEAISAILQRLPPSDDSEQVPDEGIKIAIVGRPNVGKSTLINRMLGEERVVVYDRPGTTRDSIYIPYERRGTQYVLIDTAGMRRRSKITEPIEKLSIIKTMQAMADAHVVVMVLNGREGVPEQDLRLIGLIMELGKAIVLAVNKWDDMEEDAKDTMHSEMDRRLSFVNFARRYFISALHGSGVGMLYRAIGEAYQAATQEISTAHLTKALQQAITDHQPPLVRGRRVRLRYAHVAGHHPMQIVVHGKQTDELSLSYKRYLSNYFRKTFDLVGIPLLIRFKNDANPYIEND